MNQSLINIKFVQYGEGAILMSWPDEVSESTLNEIQIFYEKLQRQQEFVVIDCNFVYSSLLTVFNPEEIKAKDVISSLKGLLATPSNWTNKENRVWNIPVCYESPFCVDSELILKKKNITINDLIKLHSSPTYKVFGIGFLPGFLYLGGLLSELSFPRKQNPSLNISPGSVAIGGGQTGIYPQNSPGGWHVVGKTPIAVFDSEREEPCLISVGDSVKFYSISKAEFELYEIEIKEGLFNFKTTV